MADDDADDVIILEDETSSIGGTNHLQRLKNNAMTLWRERGQNLKNGSTDGNSMDMILPKVDNDSTSDSQPISVSEPAVTSEDASTSAGLPNDPPTGQEYEDRNLFDILENDLIVTSEEIPSDSRPASSSAVEINQHSRKRSRDEDDEDEPRPNSKKVASDDPASLLERFRSDMNARASAKINAGCDCEKTRREMEDQVNHWKEKLSRLWQAYTALKEEMKTLSQRVDVLPNAKKLRTVGLQVGTPDLGPKDRSRTSSFGSTDSRRPVVTGNLPNLIDSRRRISPCCSAMRGGRTIIHQPQAVRFRPAVPIRPTPTGIAVSPQRPIELTPRPASVSSAFLPRPQLSSTLPVPIFNRATPGSLVQLLQPNQIRFAHRPPFTLNGHQISPAIVSTQLPLRLANGVLVPAQVNNGTARVKQVPLPPPKLTRAPIPHASTTQNVNGVARTNGPSKTALPRVVNEEILVSMQQRSEGSSYPPLPSFASSNSHDTSSALPQSSLPQPRVKVDKDTDNRVTLNWDIKPSVTDPAIKFYHLFSYSPNGGDGWTLIGKVDSMKLPMSCRLSRLDTGKKYYFAVSAEDTNGRFGPFSEVCSLSI